MPLDTRIHAAVLTLLLSAVAGHATAQDSPLERLRHYVEIDTTNPPGNEARGVAYLANVLAEAGIPYQTAESAPGRGNLWARLEGGELPTEVL